MVEFDIGRICIKRSGRDANRKCVIVDVIDKSFVLITGPKSLSGIKRRRVNVRHIEPTTDRLDLPRSASDEDVIVAINSVGKTDELKIQG